MAGMWQDVANHDVWAGLKLSLPRFVTYNLVLFWNITIQLQIRCIILVTSHVEQFIIFKTNIILQSEQPTLNKISFMTTDSIL